MKKAIVTLIIGQKYVSNFERYCRESWNAYAIRHGYELILIDQPLDSSALAQARSPAWQKCLVLSHPDVKRYDQVVWLDSDILINPRSPDICTDVPIEKIGAVDDYATPSREAHAMIIQRLYDAWDKQGVTYIRNTTASEFHEVYGLAAGLQSVVQTGVLVLSPRFHTELLEYVYHNYQDKGGATWSYEMRPLSFEIQKQNLEFWLDPRFNMTWPIWMQLHYPFLARSKRSFVEKVARKLRFPTDNRLLQNCVTTAFLNNYFLHFAGSAGHMQYTKTNISSAMNMMAKEQR